MIEAEAAAQVATAQEIVRQLKTSATPVMRLICILNERIADLEAEHVASTRSKEALHYD